MGRSDVNPPPPGPPGGYPSQPQSGPVTQAPDTIDDAPPLPFDSGHEENQQDSYQNEPPKKKSQANPLYETQPRGQATFETQTSSTRSTVHPPPGQPQAFPPYENQPHAFPPSQGPPPDAFPPPPGKPHAFPPAQAEEQIHSFPPPQPEPVNFQPSHAAYQPNMPQFQQAPNFPPAGNMGMGAQAMPGSPFKQNVQMNYNATPGTPFGGQTPMMQVVQGEPWKSSLFDCMNDPENAIITACFPCVTFGQIAEIVDQGQTTCGTSGLLYSVIAFCIAMPCLISCGYRTKLRSRFRLVESPAPDWIVHCFCEWCALCQEYRELKDRGYEPAIGWLGNVAKMQGSMHPQVAMTPPMHHMMGR